MTPERQQAIELYISTHPSPVSEWLRECLELLVALERDNARLIETLTNSDDENERLERSLAKAWDRMAEKTPQPQSIFSEAFIKWLHQLLEVGIYYEFSALVRKQADGQIIEVHQSKVIKTPASALAELQGKNKFDRGAGAQKIKP